MNRVIIFFVLITMLFGCKSINSKMYSESEDIVLYTRGNHSGGLGGPLDSDSAYMFANALSLPRETFPDIGGNFPEKDQTKEEMFANISNVVKRLSDGVTLWWYLQGHGTVDKFTTADLDEPVTYEELFEHMAKQVEANPNITRIKRLVVLILSCHSGSIIPVIKKYQGIVYDEVIAFTPVDTKQVAHTYTVFPELVNSATFLKISHDDSSLKESTQIIDKVKETLDNQNHYPSRFSGEEKNYSSRIFFSTEEPKQQESSLDKETNYAIKDIPENIQLSSRQDPSWKDLIGLTLWLYKTYGKPQNQKQDDGWPVEEFQQPQFYTYPPELENECLFSKIDKNSSCIEKEY